MDTNSKEMKRGNFRLRHWVFNLPCRGLFDRKIYVRAGERAGFAVATMTLCFLASFVCFFCSMCKHFEKHEQGKEANVPI